MIGVLYFMLPGIVIALVVASALVGIDMLEPGRRHSVEYWNPDICCRTIGCAIADHVRNVVRNIY
jgi:hypothetical protein